ncbi:MAG: 16S rRNA (cytosine(967)-C(5))-methyltransferase RsmB [Verrucomicrobiaceae bacterium]|nr:16S rRNA (cytosine(967)-C(5))-methyltransferase RsmB [Verrucomicrobiaceae bacterium]
MAPLSARALALRALREWRTGQQFADAILARILRSSDLAPSDRAFVTELFYGVLRNLTLLDFWIAELRSSRLDDDSRDLLRLGLYQLFLLGTPEHAAVFETVELAGQKARSLVNAVLRSALRKKEGLLEKAKTLELSVRTSHPQFLIERWQKNFGAENTAALCDWNNEPAPIYARINQLKVSVEEFLAQVGSARCADRTPQRGIPTMENFVRLTKIPSEALAAGHCYIQDPSTAAACVLLAPKPGERVLDACAAPGGKTAYLAELMQNEGFILACDRDQGRMRTLQDNLARLGVGNAQGVHHDWASGNPLPNDAAFDRILVDAPCSNTGVMRRRVDVRWRLTAKDFVRTREEQLRILRATIPLLKPGGALVYSTCSIEPEENEEVVSLIVEEFSSLKLLEQVSLLPFRDGFDGAYAAKMLRAE